MRLFKGTIRPGTVREVLDNGVVKASAPGLFSFEDDTEKMPPIMPWMIGNNSNAFSQPKVYDEIWIMNFSDNPRQLYWFRKDDKSTNPNIPMTDNNVEILCNRDVNGEWATIYFSDGSGWVIGKGGSIINIKADGSILLSTGMANRDIEISGSGISLGTAGGSKHTAAYGDAIEDILYSLCSMLSGIGQIAMVMPATAMIGQSIIKEMPNITEKISNISSTHVTID